ncbi:pentapeptide repeat-containing protein [Kovacikia minuta CCNUW1]|uniref:WD40 domain-containing protein n=1 Tax=Kovacikia minuta TaxID=2931930 RepID=UPI001CCA3798|nr:pentapeptide repeat-containing protein [Kovacikia minuta]UBF23746.1 pentapeptide repeat-containing protein [Kovacikia minuta CCNUW1]
MIDLPTGQRSRGVILNATGEEKLQNRMRQLDIERYPVPELVRRSQLVEGQGLHPATVRKILRGQGVDKESIALVFKAVDLTLEPQDYTGAKRGAEARDGGGGMGDEKIAPFPTPHSPLSTPCIDWGEAVDVSFFRGRSEELATIQQWVQVDHCRLVLLLGMGGIGKTTLATRLAEQLVGSGAEEKAEGRGQKAEGSTEDGGAGERGDAEKAEGRIQHSTSNIQHSIPPPFQFVIWRSLHNAPPLSELLDDLLKLLSNQDIVVPDPIGGKLSKLIEYLRQHRCLIVLDNLETLMQGETYTGQFQSAYQDYGELLRRVGETAHQSCVLLTSREEPDEVAMLSGQRLPVRSLHLTGLRTEARELLLSKGLVGSDAECQQLIERYGGNPLAIKIVSTTIQELFGGNISAFLEAGISSFHSIRLLLAQQYDRLTDTEKVVMNWLAINREKVSLLELESDIYPKLPKHQLLETLESLLRRSLIEQSLSGFTQQPVIMEFVTERFVEQVSGQVVGGRWQVIGNQESESVQHSTFKIQDSSPTPHSLLPTPLFTHALLKATARDYIRETQIRLIVQPTIAQLLRQLGTRRAIEVQLAQILDQQRQQGALESGYGAGNVLNLLIELGSDLSGFNFSHLPIWQAYLQGVNLQQSNFAGADFSRSVFTQIFGSILTVAFNPTGELLATGDDTGVVQVRRVADGEILLTLSGHAGHILSVHFSPEGQTLISRGEDQTVKFWQLSSGQCFRTLQRYTSQILSVAADAVSPVLITWGSDRSLRLWNLETGQSLAALQGNTQAVQMATLSSNGATLATAGGAETITLWEANTGQILQTLYGHTDRVQVLTFSPPLPVEGREGEILASGSGDHTIKLWQVQTGKCLRTLTGHSAPVISLRFSPDGVTLASSSADRTIRVWDVATGQCLRVLQGQDGTVRSLDFNPEGQILVSGGDDRSLKLWDTETGHCLRTWQGYRNAIPAVNFSCDGQTVVSGSDDQLIRLWDGQSGDRLKTLSGHTDQVLALAINAFPAHPTPHTPHPTPLC